MTSTTPDTTAAATTKERSPRKPQDRLPSKSDQMKADSQPPAGHETLRAVATLRSGEMADAQADILDLFLELGIDLENTSEEKAEIENSPATLRVLGKLGAILENYAADADAFAEIDRGHGAGSRMADLAMWYMAELGKSVSSAS